jgi:hypothetical protein
VNVKNFSDHELMIAWNLLNVLDGDFVERILDENPADEMNRIQDLQDAMKVLSKLKILVSHEADRRDLDRTEGEP